MQKLTSHPLAPKQRFRADEQRSVLSIPVWWTSNSSPSEEKQVVGFSRWAKEAYSSWTAADEVFGLAHILRILPKLSIHLPVWAFIHLFFTVRLFKGFGLLLNSSLHRPVGTPATLCWPFYRHNTNEAHTTQINTTVPLPLLHLLTSSHSPLPPLSLS